MKTMRRTMMVLGSTLLGTVACAGGESGDRSVDSAAQAASSASPAPAGATAGASPSVPGAPTPASVNGGAAAGTSAPGASAPVGLPGDVSAATGVFTAAQAARGEEVYTNACARCHMTAQHSGATFAATWNNRRVFDLYDILLNTMPLDDPGSLSEQEYIDVVAYILKINGHPAGKASLKPDPATLRTIRIDIKATGP
jgi:mono/diheme cytochrome c family protein